MFKKIFFGTLLFSSLFFACGWVQASSTLTANITVANVTAGVDDQAIASTTSIANVDGLTKASTTLNFTSAPVNNNTLTIGNCAITFATTTSGSPAQDTNCLDNAAIIAVSTTSVDTAKSIAEILTDLRSITNVRDYVYGHGTTTLGGSGAYLSIETTNVEASSSKILIIDGTSGKFSTTTSLTGIKAEAQVDTITLSGTVEEGDTFSVSGLMNYTVTSADTTLSDVATHFAAVADAFISNNGDGQTATSLNNSVLFTANTAGEEIYSGYSVSATNRSAVSQTVVFTLADVMSGDTFYIYINGSRYFYQAATSGGNSQVAAGLASAMSADPVVNCSSDGNTVTCVAKTAGTAFSYQTNVVTSGRSRGGSSSQNQNYNLPITKTSSSLAAVSLTRAWSYGKSGNEVKLLQDKLKSLGFIKATQKTTKYFGLVTKAALIKFQKAHKLKPYNGVLNTKTRTLLNSL